MRVLTVITTVTTTAATALWTILMNKEKESVKPRYYFHYADCHDDDIKTAEDPLTSQACGNPLVRKDLRSVLSSL